MKWNLLASRRGRLSLFFMLYLAEGLPQGYYGTCVALEMKRLGMTPSAIGTLLAAVTLPWAWKWVAGPFVDNLHLRRFGRRSQWIVGMQLLMIISLGVAISLFPSGKEGLDGAMKLFTICLVIHSACAAVQDVAIDALACGALPEEERGTCNGLMFAGAQVGALIGGAGLLKLKAAGFTFSQASLLVPALLTLILTLIIVGVTEPELERISSDVKEGWRRTRQEIADYAKITLRSFIASREGLLLCLLCVLPMGAMGLSSTVSTVITPMLGMSDDAIANMNLATTPIFCFFCIAGGWISDHVGRRTTIVIGCLAMTLVTLWTAWQLKDWTHYTLTPESGQWPENKPLIHMWWIASLTFSAAMGLMYGVRTALVMDFVNPRIAATQFTACMAMMNLCSVASYWWMGKATTTLADKGWGWECSRVLWVDALLGLSFLFVLPFLHRQKKAAQG